MTPLPFMQDSVLEFAGAVAAGGYRMSSKRMKSLLDGMMEVQQAYLARGAAASLGPVTDQSPGRGAPADPGPGCGRPPGGRSRSMRRLNDALARGANVSCPGYFSRADLIITPRAPRVKRRRACTIPATPCSIRIWTFLQTPCMNLPLTKGRQWAAHRHTTGL